MKYMLLVILFVFVPIITTGEIVKQVNPDGSVTYVNVYKGPSKVVEKEDPNVGDLIDGVKIYDISTKKIKSSSNYVYVGIKVKVKNLSDDQDVSVEVECLDANGFQLDTKYVDGIIRKGSVGYLTGQIMIEKSIYPKVKKWRVKP